MTLPAASAGVAHRQPPEGETDHLLGVERAMRWLRLLGIAVVVTLGWVYQILHPGLLALVVAVEGALVAAQGRILAPREPATTLRRRAAGLLGADLLGVYIIGTVFTPDQAWVGQYFYPLLSLEATVVVGIWAGIAVTGMSVVVYLAQLVLYVALGNIAELRTAAASVSLITVTGGLVAIYAHMVGRGQHHLRTLLNLTTELARHESQAEAIAQIDRRLHAAIGARVRSVALRGTDGHYRVTRWQTGEQRVLSPEELERVFGVGDLGRQLQAGDAVTIETDAWSLVTAALGLPEWARTATLVPIIAEGHWAGVLPVLWPRHTVPDAEQLRLLYGLAGQIGLALARGELEQMRREATVDPLTGLLNRRAVDAELEAFGARSARSGAPLAVLLIEPDLPVAPSGSADAALRSAAVAIRSVLRTGDVAGRQGGNRLLVIAADADAAAARSLARRIAAAVAAVSRGSRPVAIGIAALPEDGPSGKDLLDAADRALVAPRQRLDGDDLTDDEDGETVA